jgi:RNA polymerase sigma factor (sigma-70 family)
VEEEKINELLVKWQTSKDEAAVTELYNGIKNYLFHLINQTYSFGVDAESILNESFFHAINNCDLNKGKFIDHLGVLFRHNVISEKRKRNNSRRKDFISMDPTSAALDKSKESDFDDFDRQDLLEAIEKLPEREQDVLRRLLNGESHTEIRQSLNISKVWMSELISNSIEKLRVACF